MLGFLAKVFLMCVIQIQIRWSLPRFRYDQMLSFAWKMLLPLSLANLVVTAVAKWLLEGAQAVVPQVTAEVQASLTTRYTERAVQFIREHACEGINVSDVLRAVPLSRRVLEQRFQKLLGRTPREEVLQVRLSRVKQLLGETDLPLYLVAERTGFEHVEYLSVVFKRETGRTPSAWRAEAWG